MVLGAYRLTYRELVGDITKMYRTVEAIRGPSVTPGQPWSNVTLRAHIPPRTPAAGLALSPTNYLREVSRLNISH